MSDLRLNNLSGKGIRPKGLKMAKGKSIHLIHDDTIKQSYIKLCLGDPTSGVKLAFM